MADKYYKKIYVICILLPIFQAIQLRSFSQNIQQLETESNSIQQAWHIVERNMHDQYELPEENELIQMQTENKFIGTMMWDFFDLITFGAFEKKAKKFKENKNNSNSTQPVQVKEIKTIQYVDREQTPPPAVAQQAPKQAEAPPKFRERDGTLPEDNDKAENKDLYKVEPLVSQGPGEHPNHTEEQEKQEAAAAAIKKAADALKDLPIGSGPAGSLSPSTTVQIHQVASKSKAQPLKTGKTQSAKIVAKTQSKNSITAQKQSKVVPKIQKKGVQHKPIKTKEQEQKEIVQSNLEAATSNSEITDADIADVPFTPRADDALDSSSAAQSEFDGPRSPLPGGVAPQARPILSQHDRDDFKIKFEMIKEHHSQNIDSSDIDQIFHSYSHLSQNAENTDDEARELSLENVENAQQELFRKWDIDLSDSEQKRLNNDYITPYFSQLKSMNGETSINADKAEEFIHTMTSQVLQGQNPSMTQEEIDIQTKMNDQWLQLDAKHLLKL